MYVGADFSSLEDRISALTTKDPNKLRVYLDRFDAHCLRAYGYFHDQMVDIDPDNAESINSIENKYSELREKSKIPTFLLTYQGSYRGIMEQTGIPEEEAKQIEARYHELYKVSDDWVSNKIEQAAKDGYVTVAFGLRVRTPILAQTVVNSTYTPYEAQKEARTAGNALGQSYGLLNNRSANEFMEKVRKSPYKLDILPCTQIHDAQYYLVRDNIDILEFLNTDLIKAMQWQDDPLIYHPEVGLGGNLEIYWPTWNEPHKIDNNVTGKEIRAQFTKSVHDKNQT